MAVTKVDLAERIFMDIGLSKREAKDFVEVFLEEISQVLQEGCNLKFPGFGNFTVYDKAERIGRNPKSGVEVPIKARRVVVFHAGQKLKNRVRYHVHETKLLEV